MPKSTISPALDQTTIARRYKDGAVLLSLGDDLLSKLNGVGALIWTIIEDTSHPVSLDDIVQRLIPRFDAINREGVLRYEVSPKQLRLDTAQFLDSLVSKNLLHKGADQKGREVYRISDGVTGTTSANSIVGPPATSSLTQFSSSHETGLTSCLREVSITGDARVNSEKVLHGESIKAQKRETLTAFLGLTAFDILLKVAGFEWLVRKVEQWPVTRPRAMDPTIRKRVQARVDRAQMYYPKKAMCLQHSAVMTCLLRSRGLHAQMVLAAQEFPIKVHAWAEVDGWVVNDSQSVKAKYREMRRV